MLRPDDKLPRLGGAVVRIETTVGVLVIMHHNRMNASAALPWLRPEHINAEVKQSCRRGLDGVSSYSARASE